MQTVDAAGLSIGADHPPRIMGVLNVSQESPYDPSVFAEPAAAAEYVDQQLIDDGADIVDIGLESANKRFEVLSAEEELERLDTALETIDSVSGDAVFSIETRYHEVAERALREGFDMVNDICGFADPDMPRVCRDFGVAVCKMASPSDLERPGALTSVDAIYEALQRNGLTEKTIIDPAFGGWSEDKTIADDRETFRRLREFQALYRPILVSINRKNFLRTLADRETDEALPVSLAATSMAVERGANVIRTHDVAATRDAAIIGDTLGETVGRYRDDAITIQELAVGNEPEVQRYLERVDADPEASGDRALARLYSITGLSASAVADLASTAPDSILVACDRSPTDEILVGGPLADLRRLASQEGLDPALAEAFASVLPASDRERPDGR